MLTWICIIEIVFYVASLILFWPRNGRDQPTIPAPMKLLSSCVQSNFDDRHSTNASKQPGTTEYTGVSNGSFAFDVAKTRLDFNLKCEGALALRANDPDVAMTDWQNAHKKDTNDAEVLIYQEDLRVLNSHQPYITFVVGSILTGDAVSIGRDFLQGAYVAQYLHNHSNKSPQIYLLVANFGSVARQYTGQAQTIEMNIAQQIIKLIQNDIQQDIQNSSSSLHIKGMVLGLPFIAPGIIKMLNQSGVPVVLSGSFSDEELRIVSLLTGGREERKNV